jgi:hypothetical protein
LKTALNGVIGFVILCVIAIRFIISGEAAKYVLEIICFSFILLVVLVPVFILRSRKMKAGGMRPLNLIGGLIGHGIRQVTHHTITHGTLGWHCQHR